jgi:hypothetical protein
MGSRRNNSRITVGPFEDWRIRYLRIKGKAVPECI